MLQLLRVKQWYKNLLVFLPLIFSGRLGELESVLLTLIAFFSLSLISSAGYILNDLIDKKKDQKNPEKRNRPIASGHIRAWQALLLMMVFLLSGFGLSSALSPMFFLFASSLFVLMAVYSFWGRNELFVDILIISVNFVVRSVAGAYVLTKGFAPYIFVSPWLVLCPFFLALFLSSAKRRSEWKYLENHEHRMTLLEYTEGITHALMTISTTMLIISYGFYTFLSGHEYLMFTLPFALYGIFRYYSLVESGSQIGRHPEKALSDVKLFVSASLWFAVTVVILYV